MKPTVTVEQIAHTIAENLYVNPNDIKVLPGNKHVIESHDAVTVEVYPDGPDGTPQVDVLVYIKGFSLETDPAKQITEILKLAHNLGKTENRAETLLKTIA